MKKKNYDKIILFPLFPQYASASTGSVIEKAFKIITTDITTEQIKKNISILLDESLEILNKEVVKLKRRIRLGDLSYEELDTIYQELEASAPKKEE